MLVLVLIVTIVGVIAYLVTHNGDFSALRAMPIGFMLGVQIVIDLIAVVYLTIVLPALGNTTLRGLGFRAPTLQEIGVAVAGAIVMIVIVNGIGTLIDTLTHARHEQEAIKMFASVHDPLVKAGFAALAVIVAPLAEEFAFRVFIFNAIRKYGGFWIAAIVSGIFFGAAHGDKYAFVPLIFGGIVLCGVYARTKNAWMSMITHGLFNAVTVIALYVTPQLAK